MVSPVVGDIAQWAAVIIIGGGLWASWRRNGHKEAKEEGALGVKIDNLEVLAGAHTKKLDKIVEGLNEMKEHCARVSTGLTTRVEGLEMRGRKK